MDALVWRISGDGPGGIFRDEICLITPSVGREMVVTLHVVKYWNAHVDQKEFWARNNDVVGGGKLKRGACVLWGGIFNQEICEFRKLLHHLNTRISLPVACLTLLNLSYTLSSVTHLVQDINACPIRVFSFTIANVLLWMVISLTPFFQTDLQVYQSTQNHILNECLCVCMSEAIHSSRALEAPRTTTEHNEVQYLCMSVRSSGGQLQKPTPHTGSSELSPGRLTRFGVQFQVRPMPDRGRTRTGTLELEIPEYRTDGRTVQKLWPPTTLASAEPPVEHRFAVVVREFEDRPRSSFSREELTSTATGPVQSSKS
ncbi:conserved hypothetical protein [Culex quinquefasciatus]|uniref:Uncharacterized protein n=1 Tax=Culex quinquefasciatus TaxID=7176 RepID=B0WWF0_CULQU|nr:conserved hypothetical protein [Culex quinquefasciatus]|eukprot:XP_001861722.1 conserved hypothetical protein [Culex quinquefasciatus]